MDCKRCKLSNIDKYVLLRKNDFYCTNCFVTDVNHKFRACIGKNKILSRNEKAIICISGGKGSSVLLDLVHSGLLMENHKKLRITPIFLHLIESKKDYHVPTEKIIQQCQNYNFNIHIAHISEYIDLHNIDHRINSIPESNLKAENQFNEILKGVSSTASNDLIARIKRTLFIKFANILDCKFVITAETASTLAINLLSNLALGRGSQVENDMGFCDNRNEKVKLIKPMRDISGEEIDYYIKIKNLNPAFCSDKEDKSIQSVIKTFVTDLQDSYQSTISTVCKTADKIGAQDDNSKRCIICESGVQEEKSELSALHASNLSRIVSFMKLEDDQKNNVEILRNYLVQDINNDMFPYLHDHLCYACSRIFADMKNIDHVNHIQELLSK